MVTELEQEVTTLVGSQITSIGYENGAFVIECGNIEMRIGADTPIWCVVKEYTVQ